MQPTVQRLFTTLVFVLCSAPAFAGDRDWPIERGSAKPKVTFAPEMSRTAPAQCIQDAAACYLFSGTDHTLESDGTLHTVTQELVRLNTRRGIDLLGEYRSITFCPSYEKVVLHLARVHKAGGAIEEITPRHIHVRDTNTDHQVYDACKQVVISFPNLAIGDVIEVFWTVSGRHPEFQDQFFYRYTFGNEKLPVVRDEWSVRLPKERALRFESINGAVPVSTADDGPWRRYSWKAQNLIPPVAAERQLPAEESKLQVACSTFESWNAVHEWEKRLLASRCDCPDDMKSTVADLTRGIKDQPGKARVLAQWVRAHIRYVSRGEKHEYTPHRPARTFGDRCGDCKDSAHLLALMLREAGLTAGVATLGPRGDGQVIESLPSPWGTHALVAVAIDGKVHWIDTTAQRIGWDVLPRDDRDRACFVTDPNGIRVTRTPKLSPADQRTEVATTLTVDFNGDVTGEREIRYLGLAAWNKRDDLADVSATERRTLMASDLQDAYPRGKLGKLCFEGLDDGDAPLVVRMTFTCPEAFAPDGPLLEARIGESSLLDSILGATTNSERTVALDAGEPAEFVARWVIHVPPTFRLSSDIDAPELASRWGMVSASGRATPDNPRTIELETRARFGDLRIAPADFSAWRAFQDGVQTTCRPIMVLKPTRDASDAPQLEELCAKSPDDGRAAAALAEIYLDQKKKDDARRILSRACAAVPTDRRLWELSLTAADDLIDEEQIIRKMIRQFPDESSYALHLGQNLADQERPHDACAVLEPLVQHKARKIRTESLIALAHCCLALDEPKKALRHLRAAQKDDPEGFDADAWFLKAEAHEAAGETRQAIDAYRRSIEDEDALDALAALTRLCTAEGLTADAMTFYRRLAAQISDDPAERAKVADLAVRLGRFDDAFEFASQAKSAESGLHPVAHRPLGLALYHRQEFGRAAEHLAKAEPDAETLVALIHALVAQGHLTEAESHVPRFAAIEPTSESKAAVAYVQSLAQRQELLRKSMAPAIADTGAGRAAVDRAVCAEALFNEGRPTEWIERLLDPSMFLDVPVGAAYGLRAVLSVQRGRLNPALHDAERAIQLSPGQANGYRARGRVRLERSLPGSVEDLEKAVELTARSDAGPLQDLAYGYFVTGRHSDAVSVQREAAKLKPTDRLIREQLHEFERIAGTLTKNPG